MILRSKAIPLDSDSAGNTPTIGITRSPFTPADIQTLTICHPLGRLVCGGLEKQMLQVLRTLPPQRFRHVVVLREKDGDLSLRRSLRETGACVMRIGSPGKDRLWSCRLAEVLRRQQVDLLHVRGLSMLPDCLLAAKMARGVKVAFSFHGFEANPDPHNNHLHFSRWRRWVYRRALLRCDGRWAVSLSAAQAMAREVGLPAEQFGILWNGVDTTQYSPAYDREAIRRQLNLPTDRPILLSVGNLKPIKGHHVFLEAIRRLGKEAHGLTVVFAGRDYTDGLLAGWADAHLPDIDIRFVGPQQDPLPWYQAADLFVMPSHWEGMSNALLEAMAVGLPSIATAVGGNVDLIEHQQTGLLVPPARPEELAKAIRELLGDSQLSKHLGRAARSAVEARFALPITTAAYARGYSVLANGHLKHIKQTAASLPLFDSLSLNTRSR